MPTALLKQVRHAVSRLNPEGIRSDARRGVRVRLVAAREEMLWEMESFLCPAHLSPARRAEVSRSIERASPSHDRSDADLEIWNEELLAPDRAFAFSPGDPGTLVRDVLRAREDLALPLARTFYPFRKPVTDHFIQTVAKENAVFALATALPDVVPSLAWLPWTISEFSSDAAFLTLNQIRMVFLLAAASDRPVGYRQQRSEVGSIVAGAFGWRALARELAGKIPFGGGLIPKAAIAYAGTYVVGQSIERFYRVGYGFTRRERHKAYEDAFQRGKEVAGLILDRLRREPAR